MVSLQFVKKHWKYENVHACALDCKLKFDCIHLGWKWNGSVFMICTWRASIRTCSTKPWTTRTGGREIQGLLNLRTAWCLQIQGGSKATVLCRQSQFVQKNCKVRAELREYILHELRQNFFNYLTSLLIHNYKKFDIRLENTFMNSFITISSCNW